MTDLVLEPPSDADVLITIKDRTGTLVDPVTLVALVTDPDAGATTYTYGSSPALVKVSTGTYRLTFSVTKVGQWFVKVTSTTPSRTLTTSVHGAVSPT